MCLCFASRSERVVWRDKQAAAPHPSTVADVNRCRSGQCKSSAIALVYSDKRVSGLFVLQRSGRTTTVWSNTDNNRQYQRTLLPSTVLRRSAKLLIMKLEITESNYSEKICPELPCLALQLRFSFLHPFLSSFLSPCLVSLLPLLLVLQ